ncbi:hypothetical protein [Wenjunlia tyrosinilytica]|uniref:Uncharacterized protein n=1 Tax=Wenjunlia tyrosinilytica TaxID=1544741 RepID=A0A918DYW4_9ACTN|nr:hypothetical protein [Wenjunlia tyrosinilytica]GGO92018.1 hypothetical protein GCM10012280_41240 [Wenjunlia tyrosinilytica]
MPTGPTEDAGRQIGVRRWSRWRAGSATAPSARSPDSAALGRLERQRRQRGERLTTGEQRIHSRLSSDRADWYKHVNLTARDSGGHFIPREIPDAWVDDLRRTVRDRPLNCSGPCPEHPTAARAVHPLAR